MKREPLKKKEGYKKRDPYEGVAWPKPRVYAKTALEYPKQGLPITIVVPDKKYLKKLKALLVGKRGYKLVDFEIAK